MAFEIKYSYYINSNSKRLNDKIVVVLSLHESLNDFMRSMFHMVVLLSN